MYDYLKPNSICIFQLLITQTYELTTDEYTYRTVMLQTLSAHCGAIWLANVEVMKIFVEDYLFHVDVLAGEGLANCDEQVNFILLLL